MRFSGKTVVVTGAASGIGAESARLFASEGAIVFAADISEEKMMLPGKPRGEHFERGASSAVAGVPADLEPIESRGIDPAQPFEHEPYRTQSGWSCAPPLAGQARRPWKMIRWLRSHHWSRGKSAMSARSVCGTLVPSSTSA